MQTINDVIAHSLTNSKGMLRRFCDDLQPKEYLHRPTPKANCAAWLIGHLTLADRRCMTLLGASDMPSLPDGFEKRYARDETAPHQSDFPDVPNLLSIFEKNRDMLIAVVKRATPDQLNKPLEKTFPMFSTVGEMISFMSLHTAMHAGQITIIRRSLGRPPLI
ncbi:MAG: DinB family protein [Tepidisphaeraceae bacterium]